MRETLLALSDPDPDLACDMLPGGPLPFVDYVATMRFQPVTDRGVTFASWSAVFDVDDGRHDHWRHFVAEEVVIGGPRALEASLRDGA